MSFEELDNELNELMNMVDNDLFDFGDDAEKVVEQKEPSPPSKSKPVVGSAAKPVAAAASLSSWTLGRPKKKKEDESANRDNKLLKAGASTRQISASVGRPVTVRLLLYKQPQQPWDHVLDKQYSVSSLPSVASLLAQVDSDLQKTASLVFDCQRRCFLEANQVIGPVDENDSDLLQFVLVPVQQELRVRTLNEMMNRTMLVQLTDPVNQLIDRLLTKGSLTQSNQTALSADKLVLFLPPTRTRLAGAPALPPPPVRMLPDGRFLANNDPVKLIYASVLAGCSDGPTAVVHVRKRSVRVSVTDLDSGKKHVVDLDPLVPISQTPLSRFCTGPSVCTMVDRRLALPWAQPRTYLLDPDQSWAHYFHAAGQAAATDVQTRSRQLFHCMTNAGDHTLISIRPKTTSFQSVLDSVIGAGAAGSDSRAHPQTVAQSLGVWLPLPSNRMPFPPFHTGSAASGAAADQCQCWWTQFGRWVDLSKTVGSPDSSLAFDSRVLCVRRRHWRVSCRTVVGPGDTRQFVMHLDPDQTCADALKQIAEHASRGNSNMAVFCVFPYPTALVDVTSAPPAATDSVTVDNDCRRFGVWLSGPLAVKCLVRDLYGFSSSALSAARAAAETEASVTLSRLQFEQASSASAATPTASTDSTGHTLDSGTSTTTNAAVGNAKESGSTAPPACVPPSAHVPFVPVASWFSEPATDTGHFVVVQAPAQQLVCVHFPDGSSKTVSHPLTHPCSELLQSVCKKMNFDVNEVQLCSFGLYSAQHGRWLQLQFSLFEQGLGSLLASSRGGGGSSSSSSSNRQQQPSMLDLVFLRKFCFSTPPAVLLNHKALRSLLYKQIVGLVVESGALRVADRGTATKLAALIMKCRWPDSGGGAAAGHHSTEFLKLGEFFYASTDAELATEANAEFTSLPRSMTADDAQLMYLATCVCLPVPVPQRLQTARSLLRFTAELKKKAGLTKSLSIVTIDAQGRTLVIEKASTAGSSDTLKGRKVIPIDRIARVDCSAGPLTIALGFKEASADPSSSSVSSGSPAAAAAAAAGGGGVASESSTLREKRELVLTFSMFAERELFYRALHETRREAALTSLPAPAATADSAFSVRLFAGTFNMGGAQPPASADGLRSWIDPKAYDVYAIGTQELGCSDDQWHQLIGQLLGSSFCCVSSTKMWDIGLSVWLKLSLDPLVSAVDSASRATGIAGIAGNKGAVAISFNVLQTSFCFICCHLAARGDLKRLADRNANLAEVLGQLNVGDRGLRKKGCSVGVRFDHVCLVGDLNYRIDGKTRDQLQPVIAARDWPLIWTFDQLRQEAEAGRALADWNELATEFPPTYRLERGHNQYCTQVKAHLTVQNAPAWCDRVLWKSNDGHRFLATNYFAAMDIQTSDHRPVGFGATVKIPLPVPASSTTLSHCCLFIYDLTVKLVSSAVVTERTRPPVTGASSATGDFFERIPTNGGATTTSSSGVSASSSGGSFISSSSTGSGGGESDVDVWFLAPCLYGVPLNRLQCAAKTRGAPSSGPLYKSKSSAFCLGPFFLLETANIVLAVTKTGSDDGLGSVRFQIPPAISADSGDGGGGLLRPFSLTLTKSGRLAGSVTFYAQLTTEQDSLLWTPTRNRSFTVW